MIEAVAAAYERVKTIDPALDVLMVHTPIPGDLGPEISMDIRQGYFGRIVQYSTYADVIGFDFYAYAEALSNIGSPLRGAEAVPVDGVIADYQQWLKNALPDKRRLVTLQGFALGDMFPDLVADYPALPSPPRSRKLTRWWRSQTGLSWLSGGGKPRWKPQAKPRGHPF